MAGRVQSNVLPTHISLVPTNDDKFPLGLDQIARSEFQTLFTFTSYEVDKLDQLENHPDLKGEDEPEPPNTEVDGSQCKFSTASSLLPPALKANPCLFSTVYGLASESKTSENKISENETSNSKASKKNKTSKNKAAKANSKKKGICLAIHTVNGTIFMKTLNSHAVDEEHLKAASTHLREHGLQWCWNVSDGSGGQHILNTFKRVVKYKFGDMTLVVEDSNQILTKTDLRISYFVEKTRPDMMIPGSSR
ncbi:hypothetical protein F4820DRAFT_465701 [Hypoxylon rubiginosum]|uniref:Uncharacterized protein n=1 Tax=Hypoxylon rubiginosum TaxID=110542 RepID=A0ACB9YMN7_9PEZI|nr:hypothetical protein F4820DRAFT_465701 [Hypoxylon rubiginosum]